MHIFQFRDMSFSSKPFIVYYNPTKDPAGWHRYMPKNEQMDEGASDMKKFTLEELKTLVETNQRTLCHVSDYLSLAVKVTPDPSCLPPQTSFCSELVPELTSKTATHESLTIAPMIVGKLFLCVICKNHVENKIFSPADEETIVLKLYELSLPTSGIKAVKRVTNLGKSKMVIGAAYELTLDWEENFLSEIELNANRIVQLAKRASASFRSTE